MFFLIFYLYLPMVNRLYIIVNRLYNMANNLFTILNQFYVVISNLYIIINKIFIKNGIFDNSFKVDMKLNKSSKIGYFCTKPE